MQGDNANILPSENPRLSDVVPLPFVHDTFRPLSRVCLALGVVMPIARYPVQFIAQDSGAQFRRGLAV
jgi:hypothetical protein